MPTAEEVLATLKSEDMLVFKVTKPATIVINQTEEGKIGIDLQPSLLAMDINNTVDIMKSSVLMVTKARKDLKDMYIQSTSGIQPAGADVLDGIESSTKSTNASGRRP